MDDTTTKVTAWQQEKERKRASKDLKNRIALSTMRKHKKERKRDRERWREGGGEIDCEESSERCTEMREMERKERECSYINENTNKRKSGRRVKERCRCG